MSSIDHAQPAEFAPVVLQLFQGPLYSDDKWWNELEIHQYDIRNYLIQIGIELVLNEQQGFAYLTQDVEEWEELKLPRVIRRRPLSYEVTLLCVILYQKLLEFDVKDTDSAKLFLSRQQLVDEVELLFPEENNRSRLLEKIDSYIKAVVDLGYLRRVRKSDTRPDAEEKFEVRRIIKARLTPDALQEILESIEIKPANEPATDVS